MTTIQERLAQANPSNKPEKVKEARARVPMSVPQMKLAVPEIQGYHLHWMSGNPQRIAQAEAAGYSFVERGDVDLNTIGLADGPHSDGNTDLGSRVSVVSGLGETGPQAGRLYLMKLPLQFWEEDQAAIAAKNEGIAGILRGDKGFQEAGGDNANRYVPEGAANKNLFQRKTRRP